MKTMKLIIIYFICFLAWLETNAADGPLIPASLNSVLSKIQAGTKPGIDIGNVLRECQTIKPGMTRTELSKVFITEGGLSTATHRTYVYHDCPYVKVDVDFTPSDPKQAPLEERPTDIITHISKPYLDWSIGD